MSEPESDSDAIMSCISVALTGGRLTKGVVRVGDTVRRPASPASNFIRRLLKYFESLGILWAPRYLGQDDLGRDMLTYLHGAVALRWGYFPDDQVEQAARLLRSFHDVTRGSDLAANNSVVCHNDFGPNNTIFVNSEPIALIDFDLAAPGEPLDDVAYMAWAWCLSSKETRPPIDLQAHQVRVLLKAYGDRDLIASDGLVDAILARQERNARFWSNIRSSATDVATPPQKIDEIIQWSWDEYAFTEANRGILEDSVR